MKSIDELDHYEMLDISSKATPNEIERAHRMAQQTYAEGSLALYSVFENLDAQSIRAHIDEAYRVLSDPEAREAYDQSLAKNRASVEASTTDTKANTASGHEGRGADRGEGPSDAAVAARTEDGALESFDEAVDEFDAFDDEAGGDYDGLRLRRMRLFRGYELDDISDVTKVSSNHLRNIEEENFHALPADVYVRGFVTAYAKTIGLDPSVVVPGYMARVEQTRGGNRRLGFLGRR